MYSSDNLLRFQSYSIYVFKSMLSNHSTLLSVTVGSQLRLFGILEAVRIVGTVPAYHALRDSSTIIQQLELLFWKQT